MTDRKLIYLASPFTHRDPAVMEARFNAVCRESARLMREGHFVYSPIAHTYPISQAGELPKDWAFWSEFDCAFLARFDELWVLKFDGWRESTGVQAEISLAHDYGLPVVFLEPVEPVPPIMCFWICAACGHENGHENDSCGRCGGRPR